MATPPRLRVHSWHINIGVGDGAIHLLVDEKGQIGAGSAVKPAVLKAVLIDGGEAAHGLNQLKLTIAKIEAEYTFPAENVNQLKFDAIVITHWDIDHWYGVHQLLLNDLAAQITGTDGHKKLVADSFMAWKKDIVNHALTIPEEKAKLTSKTALNPVADADFNEAYAALNLAPIDKVAYTDALKTAGKGQWDKVKSCSDQVVVQSRYLKYGATYPTAPQFVQNSEPAEAKEVAKIDPSLLLTTFYVAHRCEDTKIGPPPGEKAEDSYSYSFSNDTGVYKLKANREDTDKSNQNFLSFQLAAKYVLDVPEVKVLKSSHGETYSTAAPVMKPEYTKFWKALYCSRLSADWADYLGAELFYGTVGTGTWDSWKNPAQLLKAVNLKQADGPRMFLVAGDQVVIGNTNLAQASRALAPVVVNNDVVVSHSHFVHPREDIIDAQSSTLGTRFTGVRTDSHQRNSASLVCVILSSNVTDWSTVTTADQQRVSFNTVYYSAGDALYDVEGAVASWLRDPVAKWVLPPISAMKLSHHGAMESTPEALLSTLRPMVMVSSNPKGIKHRHPSAELLFYLDAHVAAMNIDGTTWRPAPLLCTNYPQYFDTKKRCDMGLQAFKPLAAISEELSAERQFVNILLARYTDAKMATANLWTDLQAECGIILNTMTTYKQLTSANKKKLKDCVTSKIAGRWQFLSPQDKSLTSIEHIKAWITVVGGDSPVDDLEAHRAWRGNDVIAQIHVQPAQPMELQVIAQTTEAPPPADVVIATEIVTLVMTEATEIEAEAATRLRKTRVRDRDEEDEEPPSKFQTLEGVTETENGDKGLLTSSPYDPQNSKPAQSSNPPTNSTHVGDDIRGFITHTAKGVPTQPRSQPTNIDRKEDDVQPVAKMPPLKNGNSAIRADVVTPITSYTIYSKVFVKTGTQTDSLTASTTLASIEPGPLNDFVSHLSSGRLVLSTSLPPATSDPSSITPIPLSSNDRWMTWLSAGAFRIDQIRLMGTVDTLAKITSIDASTSLFSSTLRFNSASTLAAVSETPISGTPTFGQAFLPDYQYLVLGLSGADSAVNPTLIDILAAFGPKWLNALRYIPGFGSQLVFKFDITSGRNLLFLKPYGDTVKCMRLQFRLLQPEQSFNACLGFLGTISLTDTYLVGKKTSTLQEADPGQLSRIYLDQEIALQTTVTATNGGKTVSFGAWFAFQADHTELIITFSQSGILADIIDWLIAACPSLNDSNIKVEDMLPETTAIKIRQISLYLSNPGSGGKFGVQSASLLLEVDAFGAPFQVRLNWPEFRLVANLWTDTPPTMQDYNLLMLPDYEAHKVISPFATQQSAGIPISSLLPSDTPDPPHGIQPTLYEVEFTVERTSAQAIALSFSAVIGSKKPDSPSVPTIELGDLNLSATYTGAPSQDPKGSSYDVKLSTSIVLFPRDFDNVNPKILAAEFDISVEVQDGSWTVIAEAINLQFAAIYDLFDSDAQDSVMDILEQLTIPTLRVEYDYTKDSPAHLSVAGTLRVHTLDLDLAYDYQSGGTWDFTAQLHTIDSSPGTPGEIFIADLIKDFDPQSELAGHLADVPFIGQIGLPSVSADVGAFEDAPVQLKLQKTPNAFVLWFRIEIDSPAGALSFLFVQYNAAVHPTGGAPGSAGVTTTTSRPAPKRLIRVELNKLPKIPQIPIVGNIDQPVDSIDYVFVQDSAGLAAKTAGTAVGAGFTSAELGEINKALPSGMQIDFRDPQSTLGSNSGYVLLQGHHFMVKAEGKLVLDHIFGGSQPTPHQSLVPAHSGPPQRTVVPVRRDVVPADSTLTKQDSGTTMGSHSKTLGPLTIHNIGVQVKDDHLFLIVDCTVLLGPIQFTLMGFGIGLPLKLDPPRKLSFNHLSDLQISDFKIELAGLDVYFNAPPVLIAGYFEHKEDATKESFRGGLTVGIKAYVLWAVGAYEHTKQPTDFKSVFLFGRLDGPLLSLEFIEISGVEVGFAYNYDIRLPNPSEVVNFPLVHGPASSNNPMDLITSDPTSATSFCNWQTTVPEKYWFAVGAKADSFQLITVDLAILFAFGKESLKISIIGIASAALPPVIGQPPRDAFLYVELGITASLDVFGGSVVIGAQLSPNSYVLAPDCHLTGGAAMCYWFGPSPYAGDWVFTVGGFHPAFNAPTYYPNNGLGPPRVGIDWSLSSHLSVKGEAFFAICPKACMGGGRLDANFSCGPVYAIFTAYASFLVNFNKFFFIADVGFEVECGFEGDIGIIHFNVHAHIGANLHIQGPPFGGYVDIDLWIHHFTVYFGDQDNVPPPIPWSDFLDQVRKPGPGSTENSQLIVCAFVAGAVTDTKQDPKTETTPRETGDKWFVRAGSFEFRVECKFPMDKMIYGDGTATTTANPPTNPIYGRLMDENDGQLASTVTVTIVDADDATAFSSAAADEDNQFLVTPVFRNLPKALWQQYDASQDPVQSGNSIADILSSTVPSTISHLVGFNFESPNPQLPTFNLPVFNAAAAMEEGVFQDGVQPKPRVDAHPVVPAGSVDERPILHPTAPTQTSDLPAVKAHNADGTDADTSWTDVQTAWKGVDDTIVQAVADTVTALFGWATPSTQGLPASTQTAAASTPTAPTVAPAVGVATLPPRNLVGQKPAEVVGKLDQYYLSAPCVSVAA